MPTAICILGVSRSGTSAVTRILNLQGVHVGSTEDLMPAAPDNPRGFWERNDVFDFHERLLAELSRGWYSSSILHDGWESAPKIAPFREELEGLVEEQFGGRELWAWKDPRTALVLPLWRNVLDELGISLRCLVVVRNPLDVARSLAQRNQFSISQGLGLWFDHTLGLLAHSAGTRRGFISFEAMARDWRGSIDRACRQMDLELAEPEESVLRLIEGFFDPQLVHQSSTPSELEAQASPGVVELYGLLVRAASDDDFPAGAEFAAGVAGLRRGLLEVESLFVSGLEDRVAALAGRESELREKEHEAEREVFRRAELSRQLTRLASENRRLTEELWRVEQSLGWRAIARLRSLENRLLPMGSRRRGGYDFVWRGVKTWALLGRAKFAADARSILSGGPRLPRAVGAAVDRHPPEASSIVFAEVDQPLVSVVIAAHNHSDLTLRCLQALRDHSEIEAIEVIVVDDGSTDDTARRLSSVHNLTVISNPESVGFLRASTAGAGVARGRYLFFLNNDTEVLGGWLEAMTAILERDPGVGIVGAKLIYPDGRLQEAGGIVFRDASGWNYGKGDDPRKPEYNYVREVDYCSGAALMVRADLWRSLGGFDDRFAPMYYEDTDLCFAAREAGSKVVFQPAAVVIHHEGATAGTDPAAGMKAHQASHREAFAQKWRRVLDEGHREAPVGDPTSTLYEAREKRSRRILFVDHYVPETDRDSGSLRTFEWIRILVELGNKVVFIPDNGNRSEPYTFHLQQLGVEVLYGRLNFKKFIARHGEAFGVAILSRPHIAPKYLEACRSVAGLAVVYDSVELVWVREARQAEIENDRRGRARSLKSEKRELGLVRASDLVLTVSAVEEEILRRKCPEVPVITIPHVHRSASRVPPFESRSGLLFIGGFAHPPNADAVRWFADEILPHVHRRIEGVEFNVVGSRLAADVLDLEREHVHLTGFVDDVAPSFETSRVFVAPLRSGAGVKGKILQSLSFGVPVVTTTVGAEGLGLEDGRTALIADDPETFATAVAELYRNRELWSKLSSAGRELLDRTHSPDTCRAALREALSILAEARSARSG